MAITTDQSDTGHLNNKVAAWTLELYDVYGSLEFLEKIQEMCADFLKNFETTIAITTIRKILEDFEKEN